MEVAFTESMLAVWYDCFSSLIGIEALAESNQNLLLDSFFFPRFLPI